MGADRSLDPRQVAAAQRARRVAMARPSDAERLTGLKVGEISALAPLHRGFEVYVDEPAMLLSEFVVSAGQCGLNLRLGVDAFLQLTGAGWMDAGRGSPGQAPPPLSSAQGKGQQDGPEAECW